MINGIYVSTTWGFLCDNLILSLPHEMRGVRRGVQRGSSFERNGAFHLSVGGWVTTNSRICNIWGPTGAGWADLYN